MIRIACTSCKNVLTVDDAFAGGVCRCQHCGTIQVVPAHLKGSGDKIPAPAAPKVAPNVSATPSANTELKAGITSKAAAVSATISPLAASKTKSAPPASAAPAKIAKPQPPAPVSGLVRPSQAASHAKLQANILKIGVVIAFILLLILIVLVLRFVR